MVLATVSCDHGMNESCTTGSWENTGVGFCEPPLITFLSANQYTALFYERFCLKTPYLINTVHSTHSQLHPNSF